MYGYVYETTNKINNKKYIGQSKGKFKNWYKGSGIILKQAIKKYGVENFNVKLLDYSKTKEELDNLEKHYIKKFNAILNKQYYNLHEGGIGGDTWSGKRHSEISKSKMSKSKKGTQSPHKGKKFRPLTIEEKMLKRDSSPKRKEITINGVRYKSYREASEKLGIRVRSYNIGKLKKKGLVI
jgi:group I intron endonuclease